MKFLKRFWGLLVFGLVALLLAGALVVGKNIFLGRLRQQLASALTYREMRLTAVPPRLVLEDVRSLSAEPAFAAPRVTVGLSYLSLLRREKPLLVFVESPVVTASSASFKSAGGRTSLFPLPYAIERAVVRDGRVEIVLPTGRVETRGVQALFSQKGGNFRFVAEIAEGRYIPQAGPAFRGRLDVSVSGRGREMTVHRLTVEGPGVIVKATGVVSDPDPLTLELGGRFNVETGYFAGLLGIPFDWRGRARGDGSLRVQAGEALVSLDLAAGNLVLNGVAMGQTTGRVRLKGRAGGTVDVESRKPGLLPETVSLKLAGQRVEGEVRQAYLDPIFKWLEVPWPVRSPAWGTFVLDNNVLEAEAEFRDEPAAKVGDAYPVRGRVHLTFNQVTGVLTASSDDIETPFARIEARSRSREGDFVEMRIRGAVTDVREARLFTQVILQKTFPFPEIRGSGAADIQINGNFDLPRVLMTFSVAPGGFDLFDAALVEGDAEILNEDFHGRFHVDDPAMRGDVEVTVRGETIDTDIRQAEGDVAKVLAALRIVTPLAGRAAGIFHVHQEGVKVRTTGTFTSPALKVFGQEALDVSGRLEVDDETFALPEIGFTLYGGRISGHAAVGLLSRAFDVDVQTGPVNLAAFSPQLRGTLRVALAGRGVFGRDVLAGSFDVQDLLVPPLQPMTSRGTLKLSYVGDVVGAEAAGEFLPGQNAFTAKVQVPLKENVFNGEIRGSFTNLDLLLPWKGAKGTLNYLAEVKGPRSTPTLSGVIDFQGPILPFPRFAHSVDDYSGLVFVQNGRLSVRSFQGKLGGGEVRASGEMRVGWAGVETIDLVAEGRDMLVSPLERTRALADGSARLIKDKQRFILDGNFLVKRLLYRREVFEPFWFSAESMYATRREPQFFDDLSLNLRIRADSNAVMENSMGRVNGRFDLTVAGNVLDPVVLGQIDILSGSVIFQDRTFRILKGRLSFFNPRTVEPYLDFLGETYVKNYRVTVALTGLPTSLRPEFTSSPPLPPEDILALLALGESFKRTYSTEASTRLSTGSLLSFQLAEQAKLRAEGLFRLDSFRIDPFMLGSSAEMTARLTVGKKLSRNLAIMYSTNLTAQREEIIRMEWDISDDFSIVGIRNEWGRISFDVKVRRRF